MSEIQPNRLRVVSREWTTVEIPEGYCGILFPLAAVTGLFYVAAESEKADATATSAGRPYSFSPVFHGSGRWRVYYDVAGVTLECLLIYIKDPAALIAVKPLTITGGLSGSSADVRNADADADFAAALNGLVVNARISGLQPAGDWLRIPSVNITGTLDETLLNGSVSVRAHLAGRDNSAGAGSRDVVMEARNADSEADFGDTLIGPVVNARLGSIVLPANTFARNVGVDEAAGGGRAAMSAVQMRKSGYFGGLRGRRFVLCMPATVIAQSGSSFSATAPVLLFVAPATNEWIVRRVRIHWVDAITAGATKVRFVVDPDNRYSSGGVSMIPTGGFKSTTRGSAGAALTPTQARYNDGITAIVATAADDDEFHYGDLIPSDDERETIWTPDDEIIIPPSGSLLGYVWDGGGTDFTVQVELESANVE